MTVQKVRDIASMAFQDAIEIRAIIETLETGNTPSAIAAVNAAGTDRVAQCVYRSLWRSLLMIVARAYARTREGDEHARRAFDLLEEPTVRAGVVKGIGDVAALTEAMRLWQKCRADHRLESVLTFRDKQVAHLSAWNAEIPRPIINDIFAVSYATATAFEKLAQGAGVVTLSLDSQLVGYREQAERFWGK
jgi:hypothetical protein